MKFRKFAYISIGMGALLLFIALAVWNKTRAFVARAQTAQGVVTEMLEVRDKDDNSPMYKPVVKFTAADGTEGRFTSSHSSRPPAYHVGESVQVLYEPGDLTEARINSFGSLWLGPVILAVLGSVFSLIGVSIFYAGRVSTRKKNYLLAYGNAIQTDVQGVERNTSISVNNKNPWRIASQWVNPHSNKLRVFYSENLWFDPTKFVTSKQVTVLLDPKDPQKYYMDVSFLPELEDK